ncbi:MAG: efflux RND transporter periplasmic adaptor subunit [Chloroflexota bacterium]|nr:efflux RND transporter periplasmic adaptor subunit [Chloroflexota bacterium]
MPFKKAEPSTPTPVPTPIVPEKPRYVVERGSVMDSVEFLGRVAPVKEEGLYFEANGFIKSVVVEEGDEVKKGDVLAELEVKDLLNQLKQTKVQLDTAEVRLEEAKKEAAYNLARVKKNLELAQMRLEQAKSAAIHSEADLAVAKANLEGASVALQAAQADYDRSAWRHGFEASPEARALHQATLNYQIAKANYDKAVQGAEEQSKQKEQEIALLEKDVELAKLDLEHAQEEVDPLLKKEVERAQLTVERLQAQVDAARIYAPFDGVVTGVSAYPGRQAEAYKKLIVVADPSELEINAELSSRVMQGMSEGMETSIVFSNIPGKKLTGTVRQMPYPYGHGGGGETIEEQDKATHISLSPQQIKGLDLEAGMLAKVTVVLDQEDDVLRLPKEAIRIFAGRRFVVVEGEGGAQQRVDVKIDLEGDDYVEIEKGLTEGQRVVGQ